MITSSWHRVEPYQFILTVEKILQVEASFQLMTAKAELPPDSESELQITVDICVLIMLIIRPSHGHSCSMYRQVDPWVLITQRAAEGMLRGIGKLVAIGGRTLHGLVPDTLIGVAACQG